jgi:hypothetical protein
MKKQTIVAHPNHQATLTHLTALYDVEVVFNEFCEPGTIFLINNENDLVAEGAMNFSISFDPVT